MKAFPVLDGESPGEWSARVLAAIPSAKPLVPLRVATSRPKACSYCGMWFVGKGPACHGHDDLPKLDVFYEKPKPDPRAEYRKYWTARFTQQEIDDLAAGLEWLDDIREVAA